MKGIPWMKLAATLARSLQADMQAELRDVGGERALRTVLEQLEAAGELQPVGPELRVRRAPERRERVADPGGIAMVGGDPALEEPGVHGGGPARPGRERDRLVRPGRGVRLLAQLVERDRLDQIQ